MPEYTLHFENTKESKNFTASWIDMGPMYVSNAEGNEVSFEMLSAETFSSSVNIVKSSSVFTYLGLDNKTYEASARQHQIVSNESKWELGWQLKFYINIEAENSPYSLINNVQLLYDQQEYAIAFKLEDREEYYYFSDKYPVIKSNKKYSNIIEEPSEDSEDETEINEKVDDQRGQVFNKIFKIGGKDGYLNSSYSVESNFFDSEINNNNQPSTRFSHFFVAKVPLNNLHINKKIWYREKIQENSLKLEIDENHLREKDSSVSLKKENVDNNPNEFKLFLADGTLKNISTDYFIIREKIGEKIVLSRVFFEKEDYEILKKGPIKNYENEIKIYKKTHDKNRIREIDLYDRYGKKIASKVPASLMPSQALDEPVAFILWLKSPEINPNANLMASNSNKYKPSFEEYNINIIRYIDSKETNRYIPLADTAQGRLMVNVAQTFSLLSGMVTSIAIPPQMGDWVYELYMEKGLFGPGAYMGVQNLLVLGVPVAMGILISTTGIALAPPLVKSMCNRIYDYVSLHCRFVTHLKDSPLPNEESVQEEIAEDTQLIKNKNNINFRNNPSSNISIFPISLDDRNLHSYDAVVCWEQKGRRDYYPIKLDLSTRDMLLKVKDKGEKRTPLNSAPAYKHMREEDESRSLSIFLSTEKNKPYTEANKLVCIRDLEPLRSDNTNDGMNPRFPRAFMFKHSGDSYGFEIIKFDGNIETFLDEPSRWPGAVNIGMGAILYMLGWIMWNPLATIHNENKIEDYLNSPYVEGEEPIGFLEMQMKVQVFTVQSFLFFLSVILLFGFLRLPEHLHQKYSRENPEKIAISLLSKVPSPKPEEINIEAGGDSILNENDDRNWDASSDISDMSNIGSK